LEVAALLKLDVEVSEKEGEVFQQAGFVFRREGLKQQGRESWQVSKPKK
jgi:hypothetical protein